MNQPLFHRTALVAFVFSALLSFAGRAPATEISGTYTSTVTITDNSELVGDVNCVAVAGPCIVFGASDIKLRLNGFTITGSSTDCKSSMASQDGIDVVGLHDVAILGPGLVQKFAVFGIALENATKVRVEGVTATDNCFSGIFLFKTADSDIEKNVSVRNSLGSQGSPCGGTWLASSHNNRVRLNFYGGNGNSSSTLVTPSGATVFNNFGVGLVGTSKDNVIERNKIGGNLNGVLIMSTAQGNVVRRNIIVGNPPGPFTSGSGADIQDLSAAGANTFDNNRCVNYSGSTLPNPCTISNSDDEDQDRAIAFFGRNRLAFPQARLVNAVFHPSPAGFPKAVGATKAGSTDNPGSITVTGKVVDAACYMLHVAAATAASHKDCGAACLARGVPLAIATDDGILYFPADGNARLKSLLNSRVRASGTVAEKHDPMELKMPVGDKNQMVVRLEGGYKQMTIQSLEKIPSNKRPA